MFSHNTQIIYEAIVHALIEFKKNDKTITEIACDTKNILKQLESVSVKIYCESPDYSVPEYAHPDEDACMDLRVQRIERKADRIICHTGIHIELPKNYQLNIYPRSGIAKTGWYIPNSPGIGDSGYRGEILVVFRHSSDTLDREQFPFKEGDRVAQCQVLNYPIVKWIRVEAINDLAPSQRNDGGYGSTGKS